MTDYTKTPAARPWSTEVYAGDVLTREQAQGFGVMMLSDRGLRLAKGAKGKVIVKTGTNVWASVAALA